MRNGSLFTSVLVPALFAAALSLAGCDSGDTSTETKTAPAAKSEQVSSATKPALKPIIPVAQVADWCPEHGVPESVCTRCNASLEAGFKAKGDWCEEHKLPDSQCVAHHPELKAKFVADYKAKYGKEPPVAAEGGHGDGDHEGHEHKEAK